MKEIKKFLKHKRNLVSLLIILLLLAALPAGIYLSQKTTIFKPRAEQNQNLQIESLAQQLLEKKKEYDNPPAVQIFSTQDPKEKALNEMLNIARARKELLEQKLQSNPREFLNHAVFLDQRSQFPAQIQQFLEDQITQQGTIRVFHIDNSDSQKNEYIYRLEVKEGQKTYLLYFTTQNPKIPSNTEAKIAGISLGNNIVVKSINSLDVLDAINILGGQPPPSAKGEQKTVFILANFSNQQSQPISVEDLKKMILTQSNSVNNYYVENSYNQVNFSADFYGWYTLNQTDENCSRMDNYKYTFEKWSDEAFAKAQLQGKLQSVDFDKYTRRVFVFPAEEVCGGILGVGEVGGLIDQPTTAWIFATTNSSTYAHELGHNFGLGHASAKWCQGLQINSYHQCLSSEYGDYFDVMGRGRLKHFNAAHKLSLGWINDNNVTSVERSGIYTITPLEQKSAKILKIPKQNYGEYYYLEYRQPQGFDADFTEEQTKGVSIRSHFGWIFNSFLFDSTPAPFGSSFTDVESSFQNPTLSDGAIFYDPQNNITIKQISHNPQSATVEISYSNIIGKWQSLNYLPQAVIYNKTFAAKGHLFSVGGLQNNTLSYDIYSAKIDSQGRIGPWKVVGQVPITIFTTGAISDGNYLYILPGHDYDFKLGIDKKTPAYSAKINSDGTISDFKSLDSYLPQDIWYPEIIYYHNNIYVVGGIVYGSRDANSVYFAKTDNYGNLGPWQKTNKLPIGLQGGHSVTTNNDYLYVLGGFAVTEVVGGVHYYNYTDKVYYSKINSDGSLGNWNETTSLPKPFRTLSALPNSNKLLMFGGTECNAAVCMSQDFYQADMSSDGSLAEWTKLEDYRLPKIATQYSAARDDSLIFLLGGETGFYIQPTVYSAKLPYNDGFCIQTFTWGRNEQTRECKQFPTSCLDDGWDADSSCIATPTPTPTPTPIPTLQTPTNLTFNCSQDSTVNLSWIGTSPKYALRVDNTSDGWNGTCLSAKGDFCQNDLKQKSYNFKINPNTAYKWWVHGVDESGTKYSDASINETFSCMAAEGMRVQCLPNNQVKLSWPAGVTTSGGVYYALRVNNLADGWDGTCSSAAGDFCLNDVKDNSITFKINSGSSYDWWYHNVTDNQYGPVSSHHNFSCK